MNENRVLIGLVGRMPCGIMQTSGVHRIRMLCLLREMRRTISRLLLARVLRMVTAFIWIHYRNRVPLIPHLMLHSQNIESNRNSKLNWGTSIQDETNSTWFAYIITNDVLTNRTICVVVVAWSQIIEPSLTKIIVLVSQLSTYSIHITKHNQQRNTSCKRKLSVEKIVGWTQPNPI